MAKGGRTCRFGQRKGSLIGRVLDERGSGPKKIVGTVSAAPQRIATVCDRVLKRSNNQGSLESRMFGNLQVRFGVGAGVKLPGPHHVCLMYRGVIPDESRRGTPY